MERDKGCLLLCRSSVLLIWVPAGVVEVKWDLHSVATHEFWEKRGYSKLFLPVQERDEMEQVLVERKGVRLVYQIGLETCWGTEKALSVRDSFME